MKNPKVSVLMAAHNEEKYISEAIESIINQSFLDWELIIINDRSSDGTLQVSEEYTKKDKRIKLINLKVNKGWKSGALNKGLEKAKGKYIAFLDGDDIFLPDKLEFQFQFMEKNPGIDMLYGRTLLFGEENRKNKLLVFGKKDPKEILIRQSKKDLSSKKVGDFFGIQGAIASCSVIVKKKSLGKSRFDEKLKRTQDYDMWFQLIGKGCKLKGVNKIFYKYRIHPHQAIKSKRKMEESQRRILKKLKKGLYFKDE